MGNQNGGGAGGLWRFPAVNAPHAEDLINYSTSPKRGIGFYGTYFRSKIFFGHTQGALISCLNK